jgi:hypothetical protein
LKPLKKKPLKERDKRSKPKTQSKTWINSSMISTRELKVLCNHNKEQRVKKHGKLLKQISDNGEIRLMKLTKNLTLPRLFSLPSSKLRLHMKNNKDKMH